MPGRVLLFLIALAALPCFHAQTVFYELPANLQMFPREHDSFGRFKVRGRAHKEVVAIHSTITDQGTGTVLETRRTLPNKDGGFEWTGRIPSRLTQYTLRIYEDRPEKDSLIASVTDLVAGDFFMIAGQSNAEAAGSYEPHQGPLLDSLYAHPCCRAIGAGFTWVSQKDSTGKDFLSLDEDCRIGRPSCLFSARGNTGFTGMWGLILQYRMANASGIPTCFVNASAGGLNISECMATVSANDHFAENIVEDSLAANAPYDRAHRKLRRAGADRYLRGIFWYQGESDAALPANEAARYAERFAALREAWHRDYRSLEKVIVVQPAYGCGGDNFAMVAETQRRLSASFADVEVLAANGFDLTERLEDNCHFTQRGHERLASLIFPLSYHSFYGGPHSETIRSAQVLRAFFTSSTEITIEFDREVIVDSCMIYRDSISMCISDLFYDQSGSPLPVEEVNAAGHLVYLSMSSQVDHVTSISYLPGRTAPAHIFAGPWIRNAATVSPADSISAFGAFTFENLAVTKDRRVFPGEEPALFPNPANTSAILTFPRAPKTIITVLDMLGRIRKSITVGEITSLEILLVDLEDGVYQVQVRTHLESHNLRLVKNIAGR